MKNNWFQKKVEEITMDEKESGQKTTVNTDLDFNVRYFKSQLGGSFDIKYRNCTVGDKNFVFVMVDGMCDSLLITEQIMNPIINADFSNVETKNIVYDAADRVSASIDKSITQAILAVQKALADSLQLLNDKAPNDQVIKLKSIEAMQKIADGQATKIIIPSEMQGLVGMANGIVEGVKK